MRKIYKLTDFFNLNIQTFKIYFSVIKLNFDDSFKFSS